MGEWIQNVSETKTTPRHTPSQVKTGRKRMVRDMAKLERQQRFTSGRWWIIPASKTVLKKRKRKNTWGRQRRAPEQLVELGQVGDHGGLIQLLVAAHLLLGGERPDPKLALAHIQSQLQVGRVLLLIQRVKISAGERQNDKKCFALKNTKGTVWKIWVSLTAP